MNLDFSKLSTSAKKSGGQRGTRGTPILARVSASPKHVVPRGTEGDTSVTAGRPPGFCPPVSPSCPPARGTRKPNTGAVSHLSPCVPLKNIEIVKNTVDRHRKWGVRFADGGAVEVVFYPLATIDEVMRQYPGASVTPCPDLSNAPEMRAELMWAIRELARIEAWPDEKLRQFSRLATAQPDFTLADDLRNFRERLQGLNHD